MLCTSLGGRVEVLEEGDGGVVHSFRRRLFFNVNNDLSAQSKVNVSQLFFPGVAGPHGCKYLPDVTKLLFRGPLLYWDPNSCQKDGGHGLRENLE